MAPSPTRDSPTLTGSVARPGPRPARRRLPKTPTGSKSSQSISSATPPEVIMPGPSPRLTLLTCLCLAAGPWIGASHAQRPAGLREVRFKESSTAFANPERGFYAPRMSHRMGQLEGLRARGITLVLVEMDLRDFKDREISPEKLDELRRAFAAARENGLKVIFRAAYGFTGRDYRADPKDLG